MSKIAVVYWSGTGNTEAMADLVASVEAAEPGNPNTGGGTFALK